MLEIQSNGSKWLCNNILDTLEDCQGNFYEVRETLNGALVALLIP